MTIRLNERNVSDLKRKAKRFEVRDTLVRGLYIEVGAKGGKVWWVQITRGAKRERIRLGQFPTMNVVQARNAAQSAKDNLTLSQAPDHIKSVSDLFEVYKDFKIGKRRAWRDVQSVWDLWAKDRIGHIRLTDVNIHNGRELRNYVSSRSSELRANAVLRYLKPMFSWAVKDGYLDVNPWAGLAADVVAAPRTRVLDKREWQALWDTSYGDSMGAFFRFLMLSAQRKGNVLAMRWDEVEGDIWTIPAAKMKATRPQKAKDHEVPMSDAMMGLLQEQPRYGEYVFGITGQKPLSFGSRQRDRIGLAAGVSDWRVHDVRRTGATRMAEGKVLRFIVERVLGHTDSGVTATYDRAEYRDEKRQALEVLAASLEMSSGSRISA